MRIDLNRKTADILLSLEQLDERRRSSRTFPTPENQTPWQELYRKTVGQHASGARLDFATQYKDIIAQHGNPRHSH